MQLTIDVARGGQGALAPGCCCFFFFSVITHITVINKNINDNKGVPGLLTNNQGAPTNNWDALGPLTDNQVAPGPLTENQGTHN